MRRYFGGADEESREDAPRRCARRAEKRSCRTSWRARRRTGFVTSRRRCYAGADAIEIGVPFSDPMMDGVVIQEAALRALAAGTTIESICQTSPTLDTSRCLSSP